MSVTLHTTLGDLKFEVFCESTPKTAENFLALCASGRYDGSPFHRIIKTFICQAGAPASDAKHKTSPSIFDGQPFEDELRPTLKHNARGMLSMANKGPDTNGSQFFVTFAPQPSLDGKNTVFGKLLEGDEVLDAIEELDVDKKGRAVGGMPKIQKATIHANPLAG